MLHRHLEGSRGACRSPAPAVASLLRSPRHSPAPRCPGAPPLPASLSASGPCSPCSSQPPPLSPPLPAPHPRSMPSAVAQRVHLPVHLARGLQAASLRKRGAWLGFRVREQRPRAALAFPPMGFFTEHMRPRPPGEVPRLPPGPRGPRRLTVACRVVTASERPGALGVLCRSRSPVRGKWPR